MRIILPVLFVVLLYGGFFNVATGVHANDFLGVAQRFTIQDPDVRDGMIVSHHDNQYSLSSENYDKNMFGVVVTEPAIEFTGGTAASYPVVSSGVVEVLVSGANGAIAQGDRITSSNTPGVGMKAAKSGFVLGVAQQSFTPSAGTETGFIRVALGIKFSFAEDSPDSEKIGTRLLDLVSISTLASIEEPTELFRYAIAASILIGSLLLSFFTFFRVAQKGIDALGRNPLAKQAILMGVILNIGASLALVAAGVAGAYFVVTW